MTVPLLLETGSLVVGLGNATSDQDVLRLTDVVAAEGAVPEGADVEDTTLAEVDGVLATLRRIVDERDYGAALRCRPALRAASRFAVARPLGGEATPASVEARQREALSLLPEAALMWLSCEAVKYGRDLKGALDGRDGPTAAEVLVQLVLATEHALVWASGDRYLSEKYYGRRLAAAYPDDDVPAFFADCLSVAADLGRGAPEAFVAGDETGRVLLRAVGAAFVAVRVHRARPSLARLRDPAWRRLAAWGVVRPVAGAWHCVLPAQVAVLPDDAWARVAVDSAEGDETDPEMIRALGAAAVISRRHDSDMA